MSDLRSPAARRRQTSKVLGSATTVHARPLASQVAHELMSAILQGAFKPGDTMPSEESLCEGFDVSRPVVREAVKTLANVGMVRTRQGQGSMVLTEEHWNELAPQLLVARCDTGTADEVLAEVIELRGVLEARAAEVAARRAGPVDLERLHGHLVAMKTMAEDREQYLFYDLQFHREVLRLGGNRMVVKLFDLLEPMLLSARRIALDHQELPQGMLLGIDEHEEIFNALVHHSPKGARKAVEHHLSGIRHRVDAFGAAAPVNGPAGGPGNGKHGRAKGQGAAPAGRRATTGS
jgi:GntR family transcriptional regulator, transcriptional repressor for pyruvate dehydrogenase complex